MPELTPETLVEKMAFELQKVDWDKDDCILAVGKKRKLLLIHALKDISKVALNVVLSEIEKGEIVIPKLSYNALSGYREMNIVLKPDFKKFLEAK